MEIISPQLDEIVAGSILPGYSYTHRTLITYRKHITTSAKLISSKFNGII